MKRYLSKDYIEAWSYGIGLSIVASFEWLSNHTLGDETWKLVLIALIPAVFIDLYIRFVRWVAFTAEKAGRSFIGFVVFASFMPLLAGIVVIMFKQVDKKVI